MNRAKKEVEEFWDRASCGEDLYLQNQQREGYAAHARRRYELEPLIEEFAEFDTSAGRRVLEIGVGLGADHCRFAQAGAQLTGIDLTPRAVAHTRRRLALLGLESTLAVGDAENLAFPSDSFDVVYSWGVLHHSPNTPQAIAEVHRVLRPGGVAKVMIYHKWSLVGYMLWLQYALLRLRPWLTRAVPGDRRHPALRAARELCIGFRTRVVSPRAHPVRQLQRAATVAAALRGADAVAARSDGRVGAGGRQRFGALHGTGRQQ